MATYSRPGVFIQEVELPQTIELANSGSAVGALIGALAKGPTSVPVLLNSWTDFTKTFGSLQDTYPTTWAAYNFFANGGRQLYVKRVTGTGAAQAGVTLTDSSEATLDTIFIKAANAGTWGNQLAVQVRASGPSRFGITLYGTPTITGNAASNVLEQYIDLSMDPTDPRYFVSVINTASSYIIAANLNSASIAPDNRPVISDTLYALGTDVLGADGTAPGRANYDSALTSFDPIQNPLIFNVPAAAYIYNTSGSGTERTLSINIQADVVAYAENRGDSFVVVDTPSSLTAVEAQAYVDDVATAFAGDSDGGCAAAYYPWVLIPDTLRATPGATRLQAPGAAMIGQYLATDASRGVFKTPAGYGNRLALAVATEHQFSNAELDNLNTSNNPVNAIRQVPGAGIVVMGGRTLNNTPGDRYINVRRSLTYIKKELTDRSNFAVFENNDERLWSQIRTSLAAFLRSYWQQGGLRGASADQAFYIKCDSTTISAADVLGGRVNIEVGVAIEYPAEFIVIKLGQLTGNASA
jgi:phage tail sheath protein FI